jgi:hypothetical protein
MGTARTYFGTCVLAGELYVTGGRDANNANISSVEKYSPSRYTWNVLSLPSIRSHHGAVAVGSAMYVLGGFDGGPVLASVLKFDSTQEIGFKSHSCPQRDLMWLPVPSGATSKSSVAIVAPKLRRLSSSTTRWPASGAPWRPCPMLVWTTARVCWAAWPWSLALRPGFGSLEHACSCIAQQSVRSILRGGRMLVCGWWKICVIEFGVVRCG